MTEDTIIYFRVSPEKTDWAEKVLKENFFYIKHLAKVKDYKFLKWDEEFPPNAITEVLEPGIEVGVVSPNISKEQEILELGNSLKKVKKEKEELTELYKKLKDRLDLKDFLEKAPQEIVEGTTKKFKEVQERLSQIEKMETNLEIKIMEGEMEMVGEKIENLEKEIEILEKYLKKEKEEKERRKRKKKKSKK